VNLRERITAGGYEGYSYAYPHKTSYRSFARPIDLTSAWSCEDTSALFLYVHVPFCETRCGFCNLFTSIGASHGVVTEYLDALQRQSRAVVSSVQPRTVSQMAFGGGTPSFLELAELERLFDILRSDWPIQPQDASCSFEVSPATVDPEKLAFLKAQGVERISMGVQSFVPAVLRALGRPQKIGDVERACDQIVDAGFRVFNLDLIYGAEGQDEEHWLRSLQQAMRWSPQELYLYPLYVRELTGLGKRGDRPSVRRLRLYRLARDFLISQGYRQLSMRLFRKVYSPVESSADYCCQEDGMVGLGAGARSYTRGLHYSSEYAVAQSGVRRIIEAFSQQREAQFERVDYGVELDLGEQRRRYLIKSLLRSDGLDRHRYRRVFETDVMQDFPELSDLSELGLGATTSDYVRLNTDGLAHTDTIGPWLYSAEVQARMEACELA